MSTKRRAPEGLIHLLSRDLRPLCNGAYGLLSGQASRATCATCLSLWDASRDNPDCATLVVDDLELVGH